MNSMEKEKTIFRNLLNKSIDGQITVEEIQQFNELLSAYPELGEYYLQCMQLHVALHEIRISDDYDINNIPILNEQCWAEFAEFEKTAPSVELPKKEQPRELISDVRQRKQQLRMMQKNTSFNKPLLFTTIISLAALIFVIVYIQVVPRHVLKTVATVKDCLNVQFADNTETIAAGTRLTNRTDFYWLKKGVITVEFDYGTQVIIEAPAEFRFESCDDMILNSGRLYAKVPGQATGFIVDTPNSRVVDLGTEFGIKVDFDGTIDVHMFKGKASLIPGPKGNAQNSHILTAGNAKSVDSRGQVKDIFIEEKKFVQAISSKSDFIWRGQKNLYLTDLLLGGNGFGTAVKQNLEFDPSTGLAADSGITGYRPGPETIAPVASCPYLDCIFVPGSGNGDTVITSAGHKFKECPKTTGLFYSNICCLKDWTFYDSIQQTFERTQKQYSDSGVLYMHSNVGLTMDLNAIRREIPGLRISSFSAFAGILRMGTNPPDYSEVDVWVLVDGQMRTFQKGLRADQGYDIRVDIADQDRFLSLIVTDGGKAYVNDWPANHLDTCGFAKPVFDLVSQ